MAEPDPWMPVRLAREAYLRAAESKILTAARKALRVLLDAINALLARNRYDPSTLDNRNREWRIAVAETLVPAIEDAFGAAFREQLDGAAYSPDQYVNRYLREAENRLVGVADEVFDVVRDELNEGRRAGEDIPTLAARIDDVLYQSGSDRWDNRAVVIARTEVIGANNQGQYAAAMVMAELREVPFEQVRKRWLSTPDERTRPTHVVADGQVQKLQTDFVVGGFRGNAPGDPKLPPQEVIQCRCTVLYLYPGDPYYTEETTLVAAGNEDDWGTVIVAVPNKDDPVHGVGEESKHVTLAWLGTDPLDDETRDHVNSVLALLGEKYGPFEANVSGRAELGQHAAKVLLVESTDLTEIHDALEGNGPLGDLIAREKTYPNWIPHLTLSYDDEAPDSSALDAIQFDSIALWEGDTHHVHRLGKADMTEATTAAAYGEPEVPDPSEIELQDIPWHGVLAPEGVMSGDRRMFKPGSLRHRDLPLPLPWMPSNREGHDGAVIVGRIDEMRRIPQPDGTNLIVGWGVMHTDDDSDRAVHQLANRVLRGVSVDADDSTMEWVNADGNVIDERALDFDPSLPEFEPNAMQITDARISAATLCAIPAFAEAWVQLGEPPVEWYDGWPMTPAADQLSAAAAMIDGTDAFERDLVRAITEPLTAAGEGRIPDDLGDYWTHGEGAAKIGWGTGGDFNRCRALLAKYVRPDQLSGLCANLHRRATGEWPGAGREHSVQLDHAQGVAITEAAECTDCYAEALVASAAAQPSDFANPQLTAPTPMQILDDGRVFGHLATWGTCHIGYKDCKTAPHSASGYAYFHTGLVKCAGGDLVPVGQITIGTGHAGGRLRAAAAMEHYDNTGAAVADIAVGEDAFGIWYAGRLRANLAPERIAELRASGLSGDWRPMRGGLELVAALGVNVQGFPIPRQTATVVAGKVRSLVAAGVVVAASVHEPEQDFGARVAATVRRLDAVRQADMTMRAAAIQAATLAIN